MEYAAQYKRDLANVGGYCRALLVQRVLDLSDLGLTDREAWGGRLGPACDLYHFTWDCDGGPPQLTVWVSELEGTLTALVAREGSFERSREAAVEVARAVHGLHGAAFSTT